MGGLRSRWVESAQRKKKTLEKIDPEKFARRIIVSSFEGAKKETPTFLPPESIGAGDGANWAEKGLSDEIASASAWDVATRYHEFKARPGLKSHAKRLRSLSAAAILERAREILGSVVHPTERRSAALSELPGGAEQSEFDLEETLENAPLAVSGDFPVTEQDIWMSYSAHRRQPVILCVDTSLSMTGEKLALTAVALVVVLLQFPEDPVGIVAFENEAKILKHPSEKISLQQLVERFLDVPAQGYTHLEDGMKAALSLVTQTMGAGQSRFPSTVLLTDGKYTAGRDPAYLAPRFPHLVVLKMGREKASLDLCRELAQKGKGALKEVDQLDSLPIVMYGVVKDLLRGRSGG